MLVIAQQVVPPDAPVIQGLPPFLQFLLTVLTMVVPLLLALLRAQRNGRALDSVIVGAEAGAEDAVAQARAVLAKARRGEAVSEADLAQIGARFKTGIRKVAEADGTQTHLAPRVAKVTEHLDPEALRAKLAEAPKPPEVTP